MTKHFKRPLSILLAVMMVIGIFAAVPTTVSARTVTETGSEEIDTSTINAGTYSLYDYTGSRFYVRAFTDYCDSDGFDLGNSNSAAVMSLNGETITKLVLTIGKIETESAPYLTSNNTYATRSGNTFVFDGLSGSTVGFRTIGGSVTGLMQIKKIEVFYSYTYDTPPHVHNDITFTEWESTTGLPATSGSYVLTDDVTLSGAWEVPSGTTDLCLNGYNITLTGGSDCVIDISQSSSVLNLYDEENTGIITGGNNTWRNSQDGGGVSISAAATFNMYGGKIYNNTAGSGGGGVAISNAGAVFNMRGGIIDGNTASSAGAGGVRVFRGTFNMYGGTISNNTARDNGGGVNVDGEYGQTFNMSGGSIMGNTASNYGGGGVGIDDGGTFAMTGGSITGNTASSNGNYRRGGGVMVNYGATFNASGSAVVSGNNYAGSANDVYLAENKKINVTGAFDSDANIGVSKYDTTGTFTSGYASNNIGRDPADDFFSNNSSYGVALSGSEASIRSYNITWKNYDDSTITSTVCAPGATPTFSGALPVKLSDASNAYIFAGWTPALGAVSSDMTYTATYSAVEKHEHDGVNFTYWNSNNSLPSTAGNYVLNADVTISSTWNVPTGTTNLCLNGHTITKTGVGGVIKNENADTTLTIYDCGTTGTITGGNHTETSHYGAGIEFLSGHLILNGGIISGNTLTADSTGGGGVKLDDNKLSDGKTPTFVMNGGTISGNEAAYGGGVYVRRGVFTLNGGTISNNTARTTDGGGVHIYSGDATLIMTGGAISGNTAKCGGGIGVNGGGIVNIAGGTISGNNATTAGGGLSNQRGAGNTNDLMTSISISGDPVITDNTVNESTTSNIYLVRHNGSTDIRLTIGTLTDGAQMGVSLGTGTGVFTTGYSTNNSADPNAYFFSDNSSYAVGFTGSEAQLTTSYTITWQNHNGTVLNTQELGYGATPSYNGATPAKPADALYTYAFTGWSPEVTAVTGDATYTATFTAVPKGINYGGDNYIDPKGTQEVSNSDKGKTKFGLSMDSYLNMQMLGIQLKNSIATEGGDDGVRFVTAVNSNLLKGDNIEDYGYIVAKIDSNVDTLYNNMDKFTAEKFIAQGAADTNIFSCKGSSNSISGEFGQFSSDTDYKYVTLSVTGTSGKSGNLVARFYVKTKDGQYHYADYINGSSQTYSGMAFDLSAVSANLG